MDWRQWTILVIVAAPLLIGLYDLFAFSFSGNDATISRVLLDWSRKYVLVALLFVFGMGLLCGHLFVPQHVEPILRKMGMRP